MVHLVGFKEKKHEKKEGNKEDAFLTGKDTSSNETSKISR